MGCRDDTRNVVLDDQGDDVSFYDKEPEEEKLLDRFWRESAPNRSRTRRLWHWILWMVGR